MPLSAITNSVVGHERREPLGGGKARGEGLEVAIVDADQRRVEHKRAGKLGLVMHLGEDVHAERLRGGGQLLRGRVIDRRHDDEDAVGPPGAGLEHLIGDRA